MPSFPRKRESSALGPRFRGDDGMGRVHPSGIRWRAADQGGFAMTDHKVVSHEEWLAARQALLKEEKEFTRLRDALSQRRRDLAWERVDKDYRVDVPRGPVPLAAL